MGDFFNSIGKFFSTLFYSGSQEATDINDLFLQYMILAGVIMAIVTGFIIIAAIFFRAKKRPEQPEQIFGNKKLEISWTILPLLAVTFFFILTVRAMNEINAPYAKNAEPDIIVIAHQWWWDMRYPKYNVITANELHIPVGKKLLMLIESADVIHDWSVPELGRKVDAVPGHPNHNWIQADKAGVYLGSCNEYCGAEHAWMRIRVVAQSQEDFNSWISHQKQVPAPPDTQPAITGARLFQQMSCANCHSIEGTPANAHIGPDLTHLQSRRTLLSGELVNNRENLTRWLSNPQKVKPGAHMPNFILSKEQLNAIVTYLEGLK